MQSQTSVDYLTLYSKSWKFVHLLSIFLLFVYYICCSFSEPFDTHCNLMHEYEKQEKEKEEERNFWERLADNDRAEDEQRDESRENDR